MPAIYPLSASRVSDQLLQQRLLSQFEFDRAELVKLQDRLSTGLRLSSPSDDVPAGLRAITLQRLLEQKQQVQTNLNTGQSYLSATENALAGVTDLLNNIRGDALAVVGSTTSGDQREVLIQEVRRALEQLVTIGNRNFRGRYLFGGSTAGGAPFEIRDNSVVYHGNQSRLKSFVDVDLLFDTNVTGDEVFGAVSAAVRGNVDVNPILTTQTKLSDLRGGLGVSQGSFLISDGSSTRTIDIGTAETVGDVVRLIEANPPLGRQVSVSLSAGGLVIDIDDAGGGNLTVREVGSGTTAEELGILNSSGVGLGPLIGGDVNPRLLPTTPLADLLGTRAAATLVSSGSHNDFAIEATANGPQFNGVTVQFVNGAAAGDQAFVSFDGATNTLTIDIAPGATTAGTVVQAINDQGLFTASLAKEPDLPNDGSGLVDAAVTAVTAGGSGIALDQQSGLQIVNGDQTHTVTFADVTTVEQLLNKLNASGAGVLATINDAGSGIDVRSRLSGVDFHIGENGGTTASELGLRTLTRDTPFDELNFGRGVHVAEGPDFTILRADGVTLDIDVSAAATIGDVIDAVNQHADNQDANRIVARLVDFGNGIELWDANAAGQQNVTVTRTPGSFAAWDLGLVARGQNQGSAPAVPAAASVTFAPPDDVNSAFRVTAVTPGSGWNGIAVEITDSGAVSGNQAAATYDAVGARLVIDVDLGSTTAAGVVAAINAAGLPFAAELDLDADPGNNGSGLIAASGVLATTAGGSQQPLRSADVNPQETAGVFNSLLRLTRALADFDLPRIERAVAQLDEDFDRLIFARADVGARERTFESLRRRHEDEEVQLRGHLSQEIDADLVQTISELSARQANLEATLRLVGRTLQLTVLDFI